jgi:4-amino-4-deoxy-L-arabinose transferase-like glycosyltransferase
MSTHILPAQPSLPSKTSEATHVQRKISFEVIALGFIIVLCASLRFYHLGAASLWSDEIFSRYYLDVFGLHYVLTDGLSRETNPPTYYLLLRGWIALFGDGEAALRSLSAAASILCIPVTYLLGRELSGKSRGLAGALLFALCPASLYFAQETRVYALFMFAATVLLWASALYQRDPRSVKATTLYFLSATLCLYLHATGLLLVVACWGAVWLYFLSNGASTRQARFKWMVLNGFVLLLGLPYFLHVFTASHTGIIDYMPPAGIHQLVYCASLVVSGMVTPYPWPGFLLAAAMFLTLAVSLWLQPLSRRASVTLIGVPCLFIALVLLVSFRRPILMPRILVWTVVPLCLIAANQLLAAGRARFAVLLGLVATFGTGLYFQVTAPNSDKEPWREISRELGPKLDQADLIVLSPVSNPMVLRYYAPRLKNVRLWDESVNPTIMSDAAKRLHIASISEPEILQAIQTKHSVWVLSHSFDLDRVNDLRSQVPATVFREWFCGKVPCAAAAGWQPLPQLPAPGLSK